MPLTRLLTEFVWAMIYAGSLASKKHSMCKPRELTMAMAQRQNVTTSPRIQLYSYPIRTCAYSGSSLCSASLTL